jgi:hypothetical protein
MHLHAVRFLVNAAVNLSLLKHRKLNCGFLLRASHEILLTY